VGGLEVLCHAHHAQVTAAQAKARAAIRAEAKAKVKTKAIKSKTAITKKLK
jgi:hypothetical protein